jgi:hypothetical protein
MTNLGISKRDEEDDTARSEFSAAVKTLTFVREAINGAIVCKNCHARIAPRSISYDHIVRVQDGGIGDFRQCTNDASLL